MFFAFTSDILLNYLVTTINKTLIHNNYEYIYIIIMTKVSFTVSSHLYKAIDAFTNLTALGEITL